MDILALLQPINGCFYVNQTVVTNASHLALVVVIVSLSLMSKFRQSDPDFSGLDLKDYYRGYKYASEMIKILPQKPDAILDEQLFQKIATLGRIHVTKSPV